MTESMEVITVEPEREIALGSMRFAGPAAVVAQATDVASELARIIDSRKLYTAIQGRKYVRVEGWSTCGAMLGIVPREVSVTEAEGEYTATVELVRGSDGAVIGRASAICGMDEPTWGKRPRYARRSMAVTRATSKAFRLCLSWIVSLAGYEVTPAEEMPEESEPASHAAPVAPAAPKQNGGNVKRASLNITGGEAARIWAEFRHGIAKKYPRYANQDGSPNDFHILGAAYAEGFHEVTAENYGPCIEAVMARAARKAAEASA